MKCVLLSGGRNLLKLAFKLKKVPFPTNTKGSVSMKDETKRETKIELFHNFILYEKYYTMDADF